VALKKGFAETFEHSLGEEKNANAFTMTLVNIMKPEPSQSFSFSQLLFKPKK
jgi:hypothetical protein